MSLERLKELGFKSAGKFSFEKEFLQCEIWFPEEEQILYAIIIDDNIMYIGKSSGTLCRRVYGYCAPGPTQRTNLRINPLIINHIENGKEVQLYGFIDSEKLTRTGFEVNMAAALEDSIISQLQPEWNIVGKKRKVKKTA